MCQVLKALNRAKSRGFSDVLYLDSVNKRYIEEASSCNVFIVKVYLEFRFIAILSRRLVIDRRAKLILFFLLFNFLREI